MVDPVVHPIADLFALSVLDPAVSVAFALSDDAVERPDRYGDAGERLVALRERWAHDPVVITGLDERTRVYESVSGAPDEMLPPLAVAEFSWRDAAMALAVAEPGPDREIATVYYESSVRRFLAYLESIRGPAAAARDTLLATFAAATEVLADDGVARVFDVDPLPARWYLFEELDPSAMSLVAAASEEMEPPPFGRLSTFEVGLLANLAARRRRVFGDLLADRLDILQDSRPVIELVQTHDDLQMASAARAVRGHAPLDGEQPPDRPLEAAVGFLPPKILKFISACAAGGT